MIPEHYKNAKYEDVPAEIRKLFEAILETRRGIYIHGDVGVGKTHIAYAPKAKWDEGKRFPAKFWNMTKLLREMRLDFDRHPDEKRRPDEDLMTYRGLLFLDDVGSERITDWVAETFYLAVNERYNEDLPMVVTSNLGLQALADRIGDKAVSRIAESCDVVELVGGDRRVKNIKVIKINT